MKKNYKSVFLIREAAEENEILKNSMEAISQAELCFSGLIFVEIILKMIFFSFADINLFELKICHTGILISLSPGIIAGD